MKINDSFIMPDPLPSDEWRHGNFEARITEIYDDHGIQCAVLVDADNDAWCIEVSRLEKCEKVNQ